MLEVVILVHGNKKGKGIFRMMFT